MGSSSSCALEGEQEALAAPPRSSAAGPPLPPEGGASPSEDGGCLGGRKPCKRCGWSCGSRTPRGASPWKAKPACLGDQRKCSKELQPVHEPASPRVPALPSRTTDTGHDSTPAWSGLSQVSAVGPEPPVYCGHAIQNLESMSARCVIVRLIHFSQTPERVMLLGRRIDLPKAVQSGISALNHSGIVVCVRMPGSAGHLRWLQLDWLQQGLHLRNSVKKPAIRDEQFRREMELNVPLCALVELLRDIEHQSYGLLSWNCHHFAEHVWTGLQLAAAKRVEVLDALPPEVKSARYAVSTKISNHSTSGTCTDASSDTAGSDLNDLT